MKKIIPFVKELSLKTMIGEITSISLENTLALKDHEVSGDLIVAGTYKMTEASQIEEKFEEVMPVLIDIDEKYDTKDAICDIDDFYYEIINDEFLKVNIDILIDKLFEKEIVEVITDDVLEEDFNDIEIPKVESVRASDLEEDIDIELINDEDISLDEEVIKTHFEKEEVQDEEAMTIPVVLDEEMIPLELEQKKEVKEEKQIIVNRVSDEVTTNKISSIFEAFKDTDETFATYRIYIIRENDTVDNIIERYGTTREELANYNNLDEIKIGTKLIIPSKRLNEN